MAILATGYSLVDITGEVWALRAELLAWHIWECCTARIRPTRTLRCRCPRQDIVA